MTAFAEAFNAGGYATSYIGKWHLGGHGNEPIPRELQAGFHRYQGYQCYNGFLKDNIFHNHLGETHEYEGHRTTITTDLALEQMEDPAQGDTPFLLMVSYQAPHYPEQPSEEYAARYADRAIVHRPNCQPDIDPYTPTYSPRSPENLEDDPDYQRYGNDLDEYIRLYNAMCTQVGSNIGRLFEALSRWDRDVQPDTERNAGKI